MATSSKSMLTEAIAAARAGDRTRAQDLLSRLLRTDSSNAEYWVWMSAVVPSKRERIYCLESAIKLDPTNRAAMRGLVVLGARTPEEAELAAAMKIPRRQVAAITTGPAVGRQVSVPWKWIGAAAAGLVAIGAIWGLSQVVGPLLDRLTRAGAYRPAATLPPPSPTITSTARPGTPTITPLPAATRVMRTPILAEFAKTPLALLADVTATPTPVLGVTPHPYGDYDLGIKALIRGDYDQTVGYMEDVLKADPDLPDAHYFIGEAYRLMGEIAEAIKAYDKAVNTDADYAPAYLGRGRALLLRNIDAALEDFDRALNRDPLMTDVYLELGAYYASERIWTKLQSTMEEALDAGLTTPMIYIRLSEAQLQLDLLEEALENAIKGSADDPTLLPGYLAVGRAYVAIGRDTFDPGSFAAALWPLQTYLAYAPEDHRGWTDLARTQVSLGQLEDAMISVNLAIELQDRYAPAYLTRGILYTEMGEYEAAIEDLNLARRHGTETYDLLIACSRAYYLLGDIEEALDFSNLAIKAANEEKKITIRELKLAEGYALRALATESNPDLVDYAILNWNWILGLSNARAETRQLAEVHLAELTGEGPTRTPTPTKTRTPTKTTTAAVVTASPTVTSTPTLTKTPSATTAP